MNINEELFEKAERYVAGDISEQERSDMEALEKHSAEFRQYVHQIKQANEVVFLSGMNRDFSRISSADKSYFFRDKLFRGGKWIAMLLLSLGTMAVIYLALSPSPEKTELKPESPQATPNNSHTISPEKDLNFIKENKNLAGSETSLSNNTSPSLNATLGSETIDSDTSHPAEKVSPSIIAQTHDTLKQNSAEPCSQLPQVKIQSNATCEGENEGTIQVVSVHQGSAPYSFSLNKRSFQASRIFNFLPADEYTLWVKDVNGCLNSKTISVDSKVCNSPTSHFVFSYQKGEDFKIPEINQDDATFQLFNRAGKVMYTGTLTSSLPAYWNGLSEEGQRLPLGLYPFKIVNGNHQVLMEGTITIVD
ncbi:MAG: hypothetical protein MUF42_14670 [Cytophagaceae bacterium]|jgi:hypothetical protein|nr:hypothetical protein [Cytophagaceae bacterium]